VIARLLFLVSVRELVQMLYTNWPSTGNSFEGAFGGYDDASLYGNNSNYNSEDTIGDDYGASVCQCVRATSLPLSRNNLPRILIRGLVCYVDSPCYVHRSLLLHRSLLPPRNLHGVFLSSRF
jgi:hypothetical protein